MTTPSAARKHPTGDILRHGREAVPDDRLARDEAQSVNPARRAKS